MIYQDSFEVQTEKGISLKDITDAIRSVVNNSRVNIGICTLFLTSTTAGLFINESERMLQEDIKKSFKAMADDNRIYHHPSNAASHIRANAIQKDISIPVKQCNIILGEWQRIFLAEFDNIPRKRQVIITVAGE